MIKSIKSLIILFTTAYIFLAVLGGFVSYSPVPFWDMWNGYLEFFVKATSGDESVWWKNHNEHRIVLSRILFWIDNYFFGGRLIFLIVVNYLLIIAACVTFREIIKANFGSQYKELSLYICLFVYCLLFSWTQKENITWGFQSQFFLAQLLPLIAFYLLFQSEHKASTKLFVISCIVGFLASLSMANGVIALPLMVVLALFLRLSVAKIFVISFLSAASIAIYFYDYTSPPGHGSLIDTLSSEPFLMAKYTLLYLGAPLYYITGKGNTSLLIAQMGGLFVIGSSAYFLVRNLRLGQKLEISYVLLVFLLYIGGTAVGTAGGRALFGVEQAVTGRYMTPVLMGWAALIVLYSRHIGAMFNQKPVLVLGIIFFFQLAFFPAQLHTLDNHKDEHFHRLMGSLALEMRAHDETKVKSIFPSLEWALRVSMIPSEKNLSIFSHRLIKDTREIIGTKDNRNPTIVCQGALDEVRSLPEDRKFVALRGWLFDPVTTTTPEYAYLLDNQNSVVGYVLSGASRPDVKLAIHKNAEYSGYEGYAVSSATTGELKLVTSTCYLPVVFPEYPYVVSKGSFGQNPDVANSDAIINIGDWLGSDYYRSTHPDLRVYGSFIQSDNDVGKITLKIKNNDSLYYRSGPSSGGQYIIVDGSRYSLPLATEWSLLTFRFKNEGVYEVVLEDTGSEWGQWSAIALGRGNHVVE